MKKIITLFVAVLVSTAAFATEPGDGSKTTGLAVMKKSENTFNIYYQPTSITNVKVYIHDANGKEVYSESIKKTDGFNRPYIFSNLDEGEYSVSVIDGDETFTQKFTYGKEIKKVARVVEVGDGKFLVAIPANFYKGQADIKIYNNGDLAYKETVTPAGDFGQLFNVKKLTGEITFEITDKSGNKIN